MKNSSLHNCEALLTQVFGDLPTTSFQNSVEVRFENLPIGFWFDRGLYSVTVADEISTYLSSVIASFFHLELHDAKENPTMLVENLVFVRNKVLDIKNLLKESNFASRYENESGYKPIQTETRA